MCCCLCQTHAILAFASVDAATVVPVSRNVAISVALTGIACQAAHDLQDSLQASRLIGCVKAHCRCQGLLQVSSASPTFRSNRVCKVKAAPMGSMMPSSCCSLVQCLSCMAGLRRAAATGTTSCHLATLSHSTGVTCNNNHRKHATRTGHLKVVEFPVFKWRPMYLQLMTDSW